MNRENPVALIFSLNNYNAQLSNGQSLRVETLKNILLEAGWTVMTDQTGRFHSLKIWRKVRKIKPDLLVGTSFVIAPALLLVRKQTCDIWFDIMDSAVTTRASSRIWKRFYFFILERIAISTLVDRAKIVSFISKFDKYADKFEASAKVLIVPNSVKFGRQKLFNKSPVRRIVHVGDLRYPPNRDAAKHLLSLRPQMNIEVAVFGHKKNKFLEGSVSGYLENDSNLYKTGDVHICLSKDPAGIKNKVVNALTHGIPVLTTVEGSNGIRITKGIRFLPSSTPSVNQILDQLSSFDIEAGDELWLGYLHDDTQDLLLLLEELRYSKNV
jgi:hypothetical protein